MHKRIIISCFIIFVCCKGFSQSKESFAIGDSVFLLNNKPFVIRCGEMHFARIPKPYWRHRLQMAKAMGLNTVCAYLFWNMHEKQPGEFTWKDQSDAAEFCRIAQQEGLYVILRPGPYSCAEWELGGFPWWLLKDKTMRLRTQHAYYLNSCRQYLKEVGKQLAPLQISNGGPILMVQVENEYGSYGSDKQYIGQLRDYIKEAGFSVPLFTCDGPSQLKNDVRPDIFAVVNFGSNPESAFKELRKIQPSGPLMCGEYYPGWFDSWGKPHHTGQSNRIVKELAWMLDHKASFSIYMAHGGTTFGTYSGANAPPFSPQTSSYDYDAPITENGEATAKFYSIRELFAKHLQEAERLPPVPAGIPTQAISSFRLTEYASLFHILPKPVFADTTKQFEELNLPFGAIVYETTIPPGPKSQLILKEIHDYALIYVNDKYTGSLDRRNPLKPVEIAARSANAKLRIVCEAMGRINYGPWMHDRKGIHGAVILQTAAKKIELKKWAHYLIPMGENTLPVKYQKITSGAAASPAFYKGSFTASSNADTYLDMRNWGKGLVWVNGICMGRYWNIGPTQTMFVPGCWLKKGRNEIVIFDLQHTGALTLRGLDKPILDDVKETLRQPHKTKGQVWQADSSTVLYTGRFENNVQWQTVSFKKTTAQYFCLEALSSFDEQPFTTIAEIELLDINGSPIPRSNWKIIYADSEELSGEDGNADNIFDLQSTSIWHTEWQSKQPAHPHQVVIDLGAGYTIAGLRYLPRQDSKNGRIKDYRLYSSQKPFILSQKNQ